MNDNVSITNSDGNNTVRKYYIIIILKVHMYYFTCAHMNTQRLMYTQ